MAHLYTISHSTRTVEAFIELLKEHDVRILVDVILTSTGKALQRHFRDME
jgi:uncharacterized protein (DUF488 family)